MKITIKSGIIDYLVLSVSLNIFKIYLIYSCSHLLVRCHYNLEVRFLRLRDAAKFLMAPELLIITANVCPSILDSTQQCTMP